MSVREFDIASLKELDGGKVFEAFKLHLKRAAVDCMDRPGDPKPRKVTLEVGIIPILQEDGTCDEVKAQMLVSSVVPKHRTKVYSFGLRRNGSLAFNPDSPDSIGQGTLYGDDDE